MTLKKYLSVGTDDLVATHKTQIKAAGKYIPMHIRQIIGGNGWSLALIRLGHKTTVSPYRKDGE